MIRRWPLRGMRNVVDQVGLVVVMRRSLDVGIIDGIIVEITIITSWSKTV